MIVHRTAAVGRSGPRPRATRTWQRKRGRLARVRLGATVRSRRVLRYPFQILKQGFPPVQARCPPDTVLVVSRPAPFAHATHTRRAGD
jgi:hypothetical protein